MRSNLFEAVKKIPLEQVLREYFPTIELKRVNNELRPA
jgi:hypothetical protein